MHPAQGKIQISPHPEDSYQRIGADKQVGAERQNDQKQKIRTPFARREDNHHGGGHAHQQTDKGGQTSHKHRFNKYLQIDRVQGTQIIFCSPYQINIYQPVFFTKAEQPYQ